MKVNSVLIIILSLIILATLSGPAFTMEDDFSELDSIGEELSLFEDIPSVFGASKYEQKVTEAPSSVSIVTADEIKKYGYQTLGDILQSLRSFNVTDDRSYNYAGIRGFGRPGDYNSRMLVLVDGHRINDNVYSSATIGHDFVVDIDLIERVEVIRGPSSSIYGTSAFFAVVNVITKRGRDYQGVELSSEAGSHNAYDGRLSYGYRFGSGLELLLSATVGDSEGDDHYYSEYDDPASNNGIAKDLDGLSYKSLFVKASLADFTLTGTYTGRKKEYPTAPWWTVFNHPESELIDENIYLDLKYDHTFDNNWNVQARIFYDRYEFEGDYPYDWADYDADPLAVPDINTGRDFVLGDAWGSELQFSKRLWEKHLLVFGVEYRDNLNQDQAYWDVGNDPTSVVFNSDEESSSWAVFIQDEFNLRDNLILNLGLRHDHYSTFGGSTNPRVALIYNPLEKTAIKFLYGTAFRAPSSYENFYHDGSVTIKPSQNLEPETIETYEVVLEQFIGDNILGTLSGYYYQIEDLIEFQTDPGDGLLFFDNLQQVEAWGVEFELEGKLDNGISGRFSYTYQQTENSETGEELTNSPEHMAKLNVNLPVWRDKLYLGIEEQYTSGRLTVATDDKAQVMLKGFAVTNLTLFGQNLYEGLEVSASIYNLFDKQYADPGSGEHLQPGIEQDGRTFRLKLSYLF